MHLTEKLRVMHRLVTSLQRTHQFLSARRKAGDFRSDLMELAKHQYAQDVKNGEPFAPFTLGNGRSFFTPMHAREPFLNTYGDEEEKKKIAMRLKKQTGIDFLVLEKSGIKLRPSLEPNPEVKGEHPFYLVNDGTIAKFYLKNNPTLFSFIGRIPLINFDVEVHNSKAGKLNELAGSLGEENSHLIRESFEFFHTRPGFTRFELSSAILGKRKLVSALRELGVDSAD